MALSSCPRFLKWLLGDRGCIMCATSVCKYPPTRTVQLALRIGTLLDECKLAAYIVWMQKAMPFIHANVSVAFEFRLVSNAVEQANCPIALKPIAWLWKTYFLTIAIDVKFFEWVSQTYVMFFGDGHKTTYQSTQNKECKVCLVSEVLTN